MKTFFLNLLYLSFLSHSSIEEILQKDGTITVDGSKINFVIFNSLNFTKKSEIFFKLTASKKCTHQNLLFQFEDDISFQEENQKSCNPYNKADIPQEENDENRSTDTVSIYSITKDTAYLYGQNGDYLVLCFECPGELIIQNLPDYPKDPGEVAKIATELASGLSKIVIIWIVVAASFFVIITTLIICCCCGCCACCGCTGCKKT